MLESIATLLDKEEPNGSAIGPHVRSAGLMKREHGRPEFCGGVFTWPGKGIDVRQPGLSERGRDYGKPRLQVPDQNLMLCLRVWITLPNGLGWNSHTSRAKFRGHLVPDRSVKFSATRLCGPS